jgi:hypothetical protein
VSAGRSGLEEEKETNAVTATEMEDQEDAQDPRRQKAESDPVPLHVIASEQLGLTLGRQNPTWEGTRFVLL